LSIESIIIKYFNQVPREVFGYLSVLAFIIGDIIAAFFIPGYNIHTNMISDLGVGPGGIFFSLGIIISGVLSIPFIYYLMQQLDLSKKNKYLRVGLIASWIVSLISYILVGFFPGDPDLGIIFLIHGMTAVISWISGVVYTSIIGYIMLKDDRFSTFQALSSFFIVLAVIIFFITWLPLFEWIISISLGVWFIINASYLLYNNYLKK
jgi:uncharacterized membrane protein